MPKHVHIHFHGAHVRQVTGDAGFNESDHPRKDNGQFGSGGGGGKKPEPTKAPGQNLAHGDPKAEAAAAHARIMEKQAARAAGDPTRHFAPGSGPEAKAVAARLAAKHAERRSAPDQPVTVKEVEKHPMITKLFTDPATGRARARSENDLMETFAKNDRPMLEKLKASLAAHPSQDVTQRWVAQLLDKHLATRKN